MTAAVELGYERRLREWMQARGMRHERIRYPRAEAGGETVAYRLAPAGAPCAVVLVVHGGGNDALFGFPGLFQRLLERGFAVFAFDVDGHGRASTTRFAEGSIAGAVPAALDRARAAWPHLPLHLIGLSLGGALALHALADAPADVASAVLIAAPLHVELDRRAILPELGPGLVRAALRERKRLGLFGLVPSFGPFRRGTFPLRLAEMPPPGAFGYVAVLNRTLTALDLPAAAVRVRVPVLLVYGGADRIVPAEQGERLARLIPHAELLRVPGGTHLTVFFAPGVQRRVAEWVERRLGARSTARTRATRARSLSGAETSRGAAAAFGSAQAAERPRIDVHVHLAGVGTQGSGCWISDGFRRHYTFRYLRHAYGISDAQLRTTVDQDWAAGIAARVLESGLDYAVVLGFDGVYDARGDFDPARSQMVVPPRWVFEVCQRYANLLPGPSINPLRRDALARLDECVERGAVLLKWLPSVQAFDPADPRVRPFLRRLAEAGLPLLVHAGTGERTFREVAPEYGALDRIVPALEAGVTVICAHAAARIHLSREPDTWPVLRALLRRYPNLWLDNSGLANPARFRHLPALADDAELAARTLHGSDFPVPIHAAYYARRLGVRRAREIDREPNAIRRDVLLKQALGFDEASCTRAASVLRLQRTAEGPACAP